MEMTVGALLDYLATQPRDRRVIVAVDTATHDWSPLGDAREAAFVEGESNKMYSPLDHPEGAEVVVVIESLD